MRRAEIAQPNRPLGFEPLLQCRSNPGLADAGLTGNQHNLTFAVLGLGPSSQQQLDFLVAADERAQCRRTQCLETALDRALAQHLRGQYRLGQPLDRDSPEIAVVEKIANQPPRAFCDQHRVRWRHFLETGCQVRRLADNPALLRLARADQIADDDEAGGDADPARQRGGIALQPADAVDQRQTGPYCLLGIMLMRLRIAEIGKDAVSHILGDIAPKPGDDLSHGGVISAEHLPQIFRIEARCQRG